MRIHALVVLALACGCVTAGAAPSEALSSIVVNGSEGYLPDGGAGFAFMPLTNISVVGLEYALLSTVATNQVFTNAMVELLDAGGHLLASARLTHSITNAQQGEFYLTGITPVLLAANSTNYIIGYDAVHYDATGQKVWEGTLINKTADIPGAFTIAGNLQYLGSAYGATLYPSDGTATNYLFYGVNFTFTPPIIVPTLHLAWSATNQVEVYWPTQSIGFTLQATAGPGRGHDQHPSALSSDRHQLRRVRQALCAANVLPPRLAALITSRRARRH